jgi:hypothetical protein
VYSQTTVTLVELLSSESNHLNPLPCIVCIAHEEVLALIIDETIEREEVSALRRLPRNNPPPRLEITVRQHSSQARAPSQSCAHLRSNSRSESPAVAGLVCPSQLALRGNCLWNVGDDARLRSLRYGMAAWHTITC